jgi:hypothetical protein
VDEGLDEGGARARPRGRPLYPSGQYATERTDCRRAEQDQNT